MPEEIIALIIVLVVGWIEFAVIKTLFLGITTAVDSATKELSSFLGATEGGFSKDGRHSSERMFVSLSPMI